MGRRVALIGENSVEYINALLDIWNNGDCAVLIDWRIPINTALQMMREARVEQCYIENKFYHNDFETTNVDVVVYYRDDISIQYLPHEIREKFNNKYSNEEAVIIYSSGTTGKSKGVILTHKALALNADAIISYMKPAENDCIYITKTISHLSTITGEILVALKANIKLVVAPIIVPPRYTLLNVEKYAATILCINPTLLKLYAEEYRNNREKYNLSLLKKIYVNGAKADKVLIQNAHSIFKDQDIYYEYGLSEAGPRVASQAMGYCAFESVGKPIKGVQVKIIKENRKIADTNEPGIIHVLTPSKYKMYVSGEEKFSSLYDNWLNTGDVGFIDIAGDLHILSRIDSVIIKDAHKVYPFDIEEEIRKIKGITGCCVVHIEYQDKIWIGCIYTGEKYEEKDIKKNLSNRLMYYEIPDIYIHSEDIPITKTGKINISEVKDTIYQKMKSKYERRGC